MKKGMYNIIFSLLSQVITILMGIVLPKMIVQQYGSEINGLLSSVSQIFVYLALFEAGVGTATMQALYQPIAKDNREGVNRILSATHTYFKKTGIFYGAALAVSALVYPLLVDTDIAYEKILLIILFAGAGSILSYLFYGKYRIFLEASGNSYIVNNVVTASYLLINVGKIILIYKGASILLVQSLQFIFYILQMLGICYFTKRKYQWLKPGKEKNFDAISQKKSVLVHQISSLIFSNTDVLILTFFCGLKIVSVYTMYNYLFATLMTLVQTVAASVIYVLGKVYFENRKRYLRYHDAFETAYLMVGCILFCTLYICVIPFMRVYTAGFNDINYIDLALPILFFVIQFLNILRGTSNNLINIAGHFTKTKNRAIIEMTINIVVSLVAVKLLGIYGVLIGTIVALFYRTNDMILYANHRILNRSARSAYYRCLINGLCSMAIILIYHRIAYTPGSYLQILLYGVIGGIIIAVVFIIVNLIFDYKNMQSIVELIRKRTTYE